MLKIEYSNGLLSAVKILSYGEEIMELNQMLLRLKFGLIQNATL